jgi:serine/threonine protein kinase
LNGKRAVKVLLRDEVGIGSTEYDEYRNRFRQESQLMEWFNHPNIIRVYDFQEEDNTLFLVMEYASGGSLRERMDEKKKSGVFFTVEETVKTGIEIAEGLAVLHARDIVHRDLKPSNILFDAAGNAKVADLGLAQVPGGASMRSQLSIVKPHPGTPAYMSPEQEVAGSYLRPASDIYSLGLILFEMLTGRSYKNVRPGTHVRDLVPIVPEWFDNVLARMVKESPRERPWNGTELSELFKNEPKGANDFAPDGRQSQPIVTPVSIVRATQETKIDQPPHPAPGKITPGKPASWQLEEYVNKGMGVLRNFVQHIIQRWIQLPWHRISTRWLIGIGLGLFCLAVLIITITMNINGSYATSPIEVENTQPSGQIQLGPVAAGSPPTLPASQQEEKINGPLHFYHDTGDDAISMIFSPDGNWLYTVAKNKRMFSWNGHNGAQGQSLGEADAVINNIDITSNGEFLALGSSNSNVIMINAGNGMMGRVLSGHTGAVTDVEFSNDNNLVASGSKDGNVRVWDAGGNQICVLKQGSPVTSIALSPNLEKVLVAVASEDGAAKIWDCKANNVIWQFKRSTSAIYIGFRGDGTNLIVAYGDGNFWIWDLMGKQEPIKKLSHGGPINTFNYYYSNTAEWFITGGKDGRLLRFSFDGKSKLISGNTFPVIAVAVSPDGKKVAVSNETSGLDYSPVNPN